MQVIYNTPVIKQVAVESLPQGTVFKATNHSIWMVVQEGHAVCLNAGCSGRYGTGDIRDIDSDAYPSFSKIQVMEAVLHVTA